MASHIPSRPSILLIQMASFNSRLLQPNREFKAHKSLGRVRLAPFCGGQFTIRLRNAADFGIVASDNYQIKQQDLFRMDLLFRLINSTILITIPMTMINQNHTMTEPTLDGKIISDR
jgi:hypothetical protein